MALVTVVTADVIASRARGDVGPFLAGRLVHLKHPMLLTPFTVSRGDEIQGLCCGSLGAPEIVRLLRYHCRPSPSASAWASAKVQRPALPPPGN